MEERKMKADALHIQGHIALSCNTSRQVKTAIRMKKEK
jgi:hypothetical protein